MKDQNLSFTQIAKLVGDRWQKLDAAGKEPFEVQASAAKEKYNVQLSAYRKTDEYKEYMVYLSDFKAKHGQTAEAKRPKLEPESSGSIISTRSYEGTQEGTAPPSGHFRGGSMGSSTSSPFIGGATQTTGSSSSLPQRPQLPSSRSGTPPPMQQSREYFRPGLMSTHSSVSDESATVRSDVPDTVHRAAGLSLSTASATPPLQTFPPSASSMDSPASHDPLSRSRLSYFIQQQQPPSAHPPLPMPTVALAHLPAGTSLPYQGLPSPTAQESSWRTRTPDFRGFAETPRSLQAPLPHASPGREQSSPPLLPPIMSHDRPPDFPQGPSARTLPPPRALPGGPSPLPHLVRAMDQPRPLRTEPLQIRPQGRDDTRSAFDRSESDAASTLAGLASVLPRSETQPPLGQQRPPLPPRSSP